jgi:multiple sugar transport system permease protein
MSLMPALRRLAPMLWLGPALALIGVVVLWPVVVMVQSSFEQIGGEGFVAGYNGTANYAHLFDEPDFVSVLLRTLIWVVVVVAAWPSSSTSGSPAAGSPGGR